MWKVILASLLIAGCTASNSHQTRVIDQYYQQMFQAGYTWEDCEKSPQCEEVLYRLELAADQEEAQQAEEEMNADPWMGQIKRAAAHH